MDNYTVRNVSLDDTNRLLEIYSYYVENTAITFEYVTPPPDEFKRRIKNITARYPYLVIEQNGIVKGYAYAAPLKDRAAYDRSCELSIYIDKDCRKCGLGKLLYTALEDRLRTMGILNLYACIGYPIECDEYLDSNSADFHSHMEFDKIGHFHKCGYKFDRWYDMIWMEKLIGEHGL